jgi:hypothetical protein
MNGLFYAAHQWRTRVGLGDRALCRGRDFPILFQLSSKNYAESLDWKR